MKTQTIKRTMGADFTQGPIMPMLIRFFFPFLLANLLNSIYNTIDTIIIGQFVGSVGTVAVSLGGKMLNLFTQVGLGFAGGGQILISQMAGGKRQDEYNSTIGTLFTATLGIAAILAVATLTLSEQIIAWLNTPEEAVEAALAYLRITCIGLPLIFGYNAVSSVLRGMGDSKSPLLFIAIAALVNLVGDIVFIVCFDLGAAGTAIATVLGQGFSLLFSVAVLYRKREYFGFDFRLRSFAIDLEKLGVILKLGLPMAVRAVFISGTQLVMMGFVNGFGLVESAAYSIGDKFYHAVNIFTMSVRQAAGSMVGQNFGADRHDRVKLLVRNTFALTMSVAIVLCVFSLLFPETIFGLFSIDQEVIAYAPVFMRISCMIYILSSLMGTFDIVVTGTGYTLLSLIAGILDGVVFRVCFSFLFAYALDMGVVGFFMGDAVARFGPLIINSAYYFSGAWKRRKKLIKD